MASKALSGFLETAQQIESKAVSVHAELLKMLGLLDAAYLGLVADDLKGAQPVPVLLMMNSHAAFLAAVRIALSGQSPPAFMVLRGCLESALYALIAKQSEANVEIWLEREKRTKECRNLYTAAVAIKILEKDSNLQDSVRYAYDSLIDHGAHPNKISVLKNLTLKDGEHEQQIMRLTYLHAADSFNVIYTLIACIEMGIAAVSISPHALADYEPAERARKEARTVYDMLQVYFETNKDKIAVPNPY